MTSEFASRVLARAERVGLSLSPEELHLFEQYWELLSRWNRTINLTALPLQDVPDQSVDRLLIEPALSAQMFPNGPVSWIDLGSGGGSPAVPLKILRPLAALTMVEARKRKAAFLREVTRALGLSDVNVLTARFEALGQLLPGGSFQRVTARAVEPNRQFLEVARHLLDPDGRLLFFGAAGEFSDDAAKPFHVVSTVALPSSSARLYVLA